MSPLRYLPDGLDDYVERHTTPAEPWLDALADETRATLPFPEMLTGTVEGRLLEFLVWMARPKLVLEIGTYSGYSALSMARVLPPGGRIVSLEVSERHAEFAQRHIDASPYADRIEIKLGPALETLETLDGTFDLVFIDADKPSYAAYLDAVVDRLGDPGMIVVDNTLWSGDVVDPPAEGHAAAVAAFNEKVRTDSRLVSTVLTVRDGITLIRRA
jgi:caffeoyl-CoA O-methyltransferase